MQTKIQQSIFSGIVATVVMTLLMIAGAAMGMPKMSPPDMLATMMSVPLAVGWIIHFLIGIIFAAGYVFFFNKWLKNISSMILKGAIYGIVIFIIAQIGLPVLSAFYGDVSPPEGSMALLMIGSILGHIVFGIVIALFVKAVTPLTKQILR
jgi:uncharacterized membrane protein YagU involved in acid resistance